MQNMLNFKTNDEARLRYLFNQSDYDLLHSIANPFSKKDYDFLQKMRKIKQKTSEKSHDNELLKQKRVNKNNILSQQIINTNTSMSSEEKNPKNFSSNSNKFRKNSLNKKANRIFSLPKNYKVTDIQNVQKLFKNNKKYKNLLKGALDKELVVKDRVKNYSQYSMDSKNFPNINLSNYSKNNRYLKTENNSLDSRKIYRVVKVDNNIFNNCIIGQKMIYDITPLNKLNEKGHCTFSSNSNKKNENQESKKKFHIKTSSTGSNPISSYSSKKSDSSNKEQPIRISKNGRINLQNLYDKEFPKPLHNLQTFYESDGTGASRGAKILFLKTTYPVEIIKPLSTQKSFKINIEAKTEKQLDSIMKKYNANHYGLDVVNRENMSKIGQMNNLQKSIILKMRKEFLALHKKIFDVNNYDDKELLGFNDNAKE